MSGSVNMPTLRLTPWARVRQEDFGLLFYNRRDTRLTFVKSGKTMVPQGSGLEARAIDWHGPGDGGTQWRRLMVTLVAKGLAEAPPLPAETPSPAPRPSAPRPSAEMKGMPAKSAETTSYLRAPVNVTWEITNRCDLHCRHCLSAELRARGGPELDLAQCKGVLDHLARQGVFQLNFGGGEPFLRPDFLTILRMARDRGFTSCVSTNGLVLTPAVVEELMQIQPVYLQVSLDGATARTNDAIRGAGSFEHIMPAIRLLSQRGYPDFSINTVVTRANFMDIPDLLKLAEDCGAKTRLSRFRPSGGARECWDELRLSRELMERLSELLSARPDIKTGDSFFAITADDRRHLGLNMCGAAKMTCSIAPDGSIYPCAFLTEARFLAGHVLDDGGLQKAWQSAAVLTELRGRDINSCRTCGRFSLCHGGCPAVAYFMTSELGYADPECLWPVASRPVAPLAT